MNHYETLGVSENASPDEIKRAYREKAKQSHPDKGGQQSDFEPIVRAYEVLKDPERRQLYDTTGQDKRPPIEVEVQQLLLQLFNQVLNAAENLPIIDTVRKQLGLGKANVLEEIKKLKARKKKLKTRRTSVKSTGSANVVHMIIDGELKNLDAQIANLEHQIEVGKACLAALESYSEDWEAPQVQPLSGIYVYRVGL